MVNYSKMNSSHYKRKPKTKQFERKKVFKGVAGAPIKWEWVDEEEESSEHGGDAR